MCGIHAVVTSKATPELTPQFKQLLSNRGPDHFGQVHRSVENDSQINLTLTATVLALRGDHLAKQPLQGANCDSVLCWNGEAWKIDGQPVDGNDGERVLTMLTSAQSASGDERQAHILEVLRSIEGPFAFLFYDAPGEKLYFGRDRLGRRSLLLNQTQEEHTISFCSIPDDPVSEWTEVTADGIYCMDLNRREPSSGLLEVQSRITTFDWLVSPSSPDTVSSIGRFNTMLPPEGSKLDFDSLSVRDLKHWLVESLKLRILNVPEPPTMSSDLDIRIAILFSGGLDCTVLARLAHELLPASQGVDLINVAFYNPRQAAIYQGKSKFQRGPDVYEECPDRITGRKGFAELKTACPSRRWRFLAVNVPFEDAMAHKPRIVSLIHPHATEMDLSIAFALYFGARGIGDCYVNSPDWEPSPPTVTTPARVLLSGLGADELFGGYSRHEEAFKRRGYTGLVEELRLDVSRIGQRNLGRDDRVMAHWGKEVRFPFLDEDFVRFAIACPVWEKCDFGNQFHPAVIDPAKRVLRMLADQLNLPSVAREKKRAIQFGSRTAKIELASGRSRGTALITQVAPTAGT